MARPAKEGLSYFPLDVKIFENEKVEAISGEFGLKGELIVVKLLCTIYEKGYFVLWNELLKMKLLKRLPGVSKDMLESVVNRLVLWEFFDKALFDSSEILTSISIQDTYFEATKRRKIQKPSLYVINVDRNLSSTVVNDDINQQSKVNESKVNESKLNEISNTTDNEKSVKDIYRFYESNGFGTLAPKTMEDFDYWINDFKKIGATESDAIELIIFAMGFAVDYNKRSYGYTNKVLKDWEQKRYLSVADAKAGQLHKKMQAAEKEHSKISENDLPDWG
ncbi:DUF4373 domain-containing protein [Enterococcus sp. BWB1-3]|uniref:Lin1244/Lin1753 domain-containing protein n=1 Tax=Enterococcus sp. BWB1-3 TaxID=2787713 RepID=UPI001923C13E|nr:Lin1244/Lin1753 domain-containing protein [Enterococcus sp. BWB1-3]MBL1228179.1 DUF4373 domain-containing protein [Enterococcus sp. BWB1-3]